jgi:NADH-quinone oxidoreductase subunit L
LLLFNNYNNFLLKIILLFSLTRIFFRGFLRIFEKDIKKIIALRTLSQIRFCFFIFSIDFFYFSFIHLIRHSFFKRNLFIQSGFLIFFSLGERKKNYLKFKNKILNFRFLLRIFCLFGLIFNSGLIRKDLILEIFFNFNFYFIVFTLLFFSIILTFYYSFILIIILKNFYFNTKINYIIYFCRILIIFFIIFIINIFLSNLKYKIYFFNIEFFFVFIIFFLFLLFSFFNSKKNSLLLKKEFLILNFYNFISKTFLIKFIFIEIDFFFIIFKNLNFLIYFLNFIYKNFLLKINFILLIFIIILI